MGVLKRSKLITPKKKAVAPVLGLTEAGSLTKMQVIAELAKSTHGDLKPLVPIASMLAVQDPEFLAHLISYNEKNGQMRDSKIGLPVASLVDKAFSKTEPYSENSYAHLALLDPRMLLKAILFSRDLRIGGRRRKRLFDLVELYLRERETNYGWWESMTVQHRNSVKSLYAISHVRPCGFADAILFKGNYPKNSVFEAIRKLKDMTPREAASVIIDRHIPFLVVVGALGTKAKDTDLIMALIESMSPAELITNTSTLQKLGIKENPVLRAAYEEGLKKVVASKKTSTFKTTRAVESMGDTGSGSIKEKLKAVQEKQIDALGGVEGNWLVIGDKSYSMHQAIDTTRLVAGTLARMVKGNVHVVWVDESPRYYNATGKTYDEIIAETSGVVAGGNTCLGCGIASINEKGIEVDGITLVSDGGENRQPLFSKAYADYAKKIGKEPPVYFYKLRGDPDRVSVGMEDAGIEMTTNDLTNMKIDYYSMPNLIKTMSTKRYGLVDTVLDTPLLKVKDVIKTKGDCWAF